MIENEQITIVVPTYNRAYALERTIHSYFHQSSVGEIIFVLDGCSDNTSEIIQQASLDYPKIKVKIIRNDERCGVVQSRIIGYNEAESDYILFCDDDNILECNYTEACKEIFEKYENIGAVSGRLIYQTNNETIDQSIKRFRDSWNDAAFFDFRSFCFNANAKLSDKSIVPITHSIILTKKKYLIEHGFDNYYSKGNSYREESDYQATLLSLGLNIVVTNRTYSIHLDNKTVVSGGNRMNRFKRFYWNSRFSIYFGEKHFTTYKKLYPKKLPNTKFQFKLRMVMSQFVILFLKPLKTIIVKLTQ